MNKFIYLNVGYGNRLFVFIVVSFGIQIVIFELNSVFVMRNFFFVSIENKIGVCVFCQFDIKVYSYIKWIFFCIIEISICFY